MSKRVTKSIQNKYEIMKSTQNDFKNTLYVISLIPLGKQIIIYLNPKMSNVDSIENAIVELIMVYRFVKHMINQFLQPLNISSILNLEYHKLEFWTNTFFLLGPLQVYIFFKLLFTACGNSLLIVKFLMGKAPGVLLGISILKLYIAKITDSVIISYDHDSPSNWSKDSPVDIKIQYNDIDPATTSSLSDIPNKQESEHSIFYPFYSSIISIKKLIKKSLKGAVSIIIQLIYDLFF